MESVGLLAFGVCTLSLVALFVYWRVLDRDPAPIDTEPDVRNSPNVVDRSETDARRVTCPRCGAGNDAHSMVTFCWQCVERLGRR